MYCVPSTVPARRLAARRPSRSITVRCSPVSHQAPTLSPGSDWEVDILAIRARMCRSRLIEAWGLSPSRA
jgi:hypothetical protein